MLQHFGIILRFSRVCILDDNPAIFNKQMALKHIWFQNREAFSEMVLVIVIYMLLRSNRRAELESVRDYVVSAKRPLFCNSVPENCYKRKHRDTRR